MTHFSHRWCSRPTHPSAWVTPRCAVAKCHSIIIHYVSHECHQALVRRNQLPNESGCSWPMMISSEQASACVCLTLHESHKCRRNSTSVFEFDGWVQVNSHSHIQTDSVSIIISSHSTTFGAMMEAVWCFPIFKRDIYTSSYEWDQSDCIIIMFWAQITTNKLQILPFSSVCWKNVP